ncbi:MAG: hypothetical protein Tsb009_38960 [Planctomycetaceae bacterium]
MKKFAAFLMIVAVCAFSVGCGKKSSKKSSDGKSGSKTASSKS